MTSEKLIPITEELLLKYHQISELLDASLRGDSIFSEIQTYRLIANHQLAPQYSEHAPIAGVLGMEKIHDNGEHLAVMGYNLFDTEYGLVASICQTPTGAAPGSLSRKVRQEFLHDCTFRTDMMNAFFLLTQQYGIRGVMVISAMNHAKVLSEDIDFDRGCEIIDDIAMTLGMNLGEDGNYWFWFY